MPYTARIDPPLLTSATTPRFASCTYLDTTTHTHAELGELYARSLEALPVASTSGVLLRTCHRLEWYQAPAPPGSATVPDLPGSRAILGHHEALVRLAQIAAGTQSLIAGERFVFHQVRQAFSLLEDGHALWHAADDALAIAAQARDRFGLIARLDYTDLVRLLLEKEQGPQPRTLVVVGGGVLARAVAREFAPARHVVMLTRQPKRLRRHLTAQAIRAVPTRAAGLGTHLDGQAYDAVIATSGLSQEHKAHIAAVTTADACRATIDLCMVPARHSGPGYHHFHHPDVVEEIRRANQVVADRARQADAWIEHRVRRQG